MPSNAFCVWDHERVTCRFVLKTFHTTLVLLVVDQNKTRIMDKDSRAKVVELKQTRGKSRTFVNPQTVYLYLFHLQNFLSV